jgi:hypothetical protein
MVWPALQQGALVVPRARVVTGEVVRSGCTLLE